MTVKWWNLVSNGEQSWGSILGLGRPTYEARAVDAYPIISQDPLGSLPGLVAPNAEQAARGLLRTGLGVSILQAFISAENHSNILQMRKLKLRKEKGFSKFPLSK